jgi:sugar/nucleoside kinase (ribokinase family)
LTVGEAFEDLVFASLPRLPGPGEEVRTTAFTRTAGGGALITAVAAARLGARCAILSGMSREAAALLRREGVAVRNLRRQGEPHAVTAALSTRRDRAFATFTGVNDRLEPRYLRALLRVRARHVHLALSPRRLGRWTRAAERLRRLGASTSWDPGWDERLARDPDLPKLLAAVDYVFLNDKEAALYSGQPALAAAIRYWRACARNAVIKLGAQGSRWISASLDLCASAPRVEAVDTTGAGDAFDGGFLHALLRGRSPRACLRAGNRVGARSTRAPGGLLGLPRRRSLR